MSIDSDSCDRFFICAAYTMSNIHRKRFSEKKPLSYLCTFIFTIFLHDYSYLHLALRNSNRLTFEPVSLGLFSVKIWPALEKSLSQGTDVAAMQRRFFM